MQGFLHVLFHAVFRLLSFGQRDVHRFDLLLLPADSFFERQGLMRQLFSLDMLIFNLFICLIKLVLGHFQMDLEFLDLAAALFEQLIFLFLLQFDCI